jgi:type I restriction enzyme S subunit
MDEQRAILTAVAAETQPVTAAIARLEAEIRFLREYRTRLVADVVTGKLDVREAAARLPDDGAAGIAAESDEVDDPELIDEEATEA